MEIFRPKKPEIVEAGIHASELESRLTQKIIKVGIRPYYQGDIVLVGSRSLGFWISLNRLLKAGELYGVNEYEVRVWHTRLNDQARRRDLNRDEISLLGEDYSKVPPFIKSFLNGNFGVPGSDIDLLLANSTGQINGLNRHITHEKVRSQVWDIWVNDPEDNK